MALKLLLISCFKRKRMCIKVLEHFACFTVFSEMFLAISHSCFSHSLDQRDSFVLPGSDFQIILLEI